MCSVFVMAITRKADAVFEQGSDCAAVVYKDMAAVMLSLSENEIPNERTQTNYLFPPTHYSCHSG